jgi:rhamnogalacturonan acetylesterase
MFRSFICVIAILICPTIAPAQTTPPTTQRTLSELFIIGDSTVKNHGNIEGWGDPIADYFDHSRILIENDALGGRSSRTFITEGHWDDVRAKLRKGDFVLMQFGHNDGKSTISAARYSLPGLGDEIENSVDPKTNQPIVIHTFGFYMRKMIDESRAAGATPIVLSSVPRCKWSKGRIVRGEDNHGPWAAQIAAAEGVQFVDLNGFIADCYDAIGQPIIKAMYFPNDNTHTNPAGARVNAACVVLGLFQLKDCPLCGFMIPTAATDAATAATITPTTRPAPATQP